MPARAGGPEAVTVLVGKFEKRRRREGRRRPALGPTEAYETTWYRVLARQASGELAEPNGGPDPLAADPPNADDHDSTVHEPSSGPERHVPSDAAGGSETARPGPRLSRSSEPAGGSIQPEPQPPQPPTPPPKTPEEPARSQPAARGLERVTRAPASVRIGVRRLEDPEGVYLRYITASPHAEFFRSDLWPSTGALTPVHVWRANHLGAGWVTTEVLRFLQLHGQRLSQLVSVAPATATAGSPDRHAWIRRLFHSEVVADFGVPKVAKTLHPLLPTLVPDLDAEMTPRAAGEWLGLRRPPETQDDVEAWLEVWEMIEDVLVVRAEAFDEVVRAVRGKARRLAPTSPAGLVTAAFWQSFWEEGSRDAASSPIGEPATQARDGSPGTAPPKRRAPRSSRARASEPPDAPDRAPASKSKPKPKPKPKAAGRPKPAPAARGVAGVAAPAAPAEEAGPATMGAGKPRTRSSAPKHGA